MKLIKPSFQIIEQSSGIEGVYKQIEWAGKHCYKSLDKITEDSAKKFVDRMIQSGHGAVLEHGTVYLRYDFKAGGDSNSTAYWLWSKYNENKYSESVQAQPIPGVPNGFVAITTNYRVLVENDWLDDLKYLCEPTEYHKKRVCVRFICDRVTGESFLRHRVFSFARESTRYCNYSKDKFNNELTFIKPCWIKEEDLPKVFNNYTKDIWGSLFYGFYYGVTEKGKSAGFNVSPERNFLFSLQVAEQLYLELLNQGWKPQQARNVLPFCIKSPLIMTGFVSDWKHFFDLRCDSAAHPQARELAIPLKEEFIKRGYEI